MTAPRSAFDVAANPLRVTRFDVNDASRIACPLTRAARERTTVSTSGSSGKVLLFLGRFDKDASSARGLENAQQPYDSDQHHVSSIEGARGGHAPLPVSN